MQSIGSLVLAHAQMAATLARLDIGSTGSASVRVYSTPIPTAVGEHADTPMSTVALARPSGVVDAGALTLAPVEAGLVMTAGHPRWAELVAADGAVLHMGDVTDTDHDGFWRVSGATTPEGETSPYFAAGGLLSLGTVVLT